MPQPPRHVQLIRVHPRFQNAILRRADERDLNPRSVEPSCANAAVHRAAANDIDFRNPRGPRLRWNGLFGPTLVKRWRQARVPQPLPLGSACDVGRFLRQPRDQIGDDGQSRRQPPPQRKSHHH